MQKQEYNKRKVGADYEDLAVGYLQRQGLWIMEHNFRARFGEIDIIARDGDTIVFVEVKYRKTAVYGYPMEAVGIKKQRIISRVSDYYRMKKHLTEYVPMRFDVVSICGAEVTWYRNAFPYRSR